MFNENKLSDYETECLARRLQSEFIERKQRIHGRQCAHRYDRPEYLKTFRVAVESHPLWSFHRILDGAFAAIPDPQPEDLVGEEALTRTNSAPRSKHQSDEAWADDPALVRARLDQETAWLEASLSYGEYPGQAIVRYLAALRMDGSLIPSSALVAMAREAVLDAKIYVGIADELDRNVEGIDVFARLEEAAEMLAEIDERGEFG